MEFQAKLQSDLQTKCLEVLMKRSVGFHNDRISGKLVSDAIDYPNAFGNLLVTVVINLLPFLVIVLSGIVIVGWHSWQLGLSLALVVGVTIWLIWTDSRRRAGLRNKRLQANKKVTGHMSDVIVNIQTVKTFAREGFELDTHRQLNTKLQHLRLHDWTQTGIRGSNRMAALLGMQVLFIAYVVHLVQQNPAVLSIGIFAFSYTITLTNRLFDLSTMIRVTDENLLNAAPMTEIFMQTAEIKDAPHAHPINAEKGAINFEHVSFQYPDTQGHDNVFNDLSLHIKSGEKIGLIGPSGGGKSTFTRLLLRFEDITSGTIQIDDQAINEVTQSSLRQAISYVPQEPLLFHRSIRENIAYGKADATDEEIIAVAEKAYAHDFIKTLPNGYDTIVGERGVKLSGGQRQRVAIARAMLKNAPILVLDEATSALDSESEKVIQKALWELMDNKTAIVIAHRLSTIQKMDRIIVLDEGKIVEEGPHKALLEKGGLYARLWAHQSGGFIEE